MKKCCPKSCIISVIAVFIFLNLYGMLVHGHLLMDDYKATANLWRSEEEMQSLGQYWAIYYLILAMVLTCFFKKFRTAAAVCTCGPECACGPNCPCKTAATDCNSCCPIKSGGLCFGIKVGLIMGLGMGCGFLYMPIPFSLAVKWFFTGLFEGIGAGVILGMTYRGNKTGCASTSCDSKGNT